MVTVPHIMVRLERMLDYRGVRLARFYCMWTLYSTYSVWLCIVQYIGTVHCVWALYYSTMWTLYSAYSVWLCIVQ